jgi:hypothetical protein
MIVMKLKWVLVSAPSKRSRSAEESSAAQEIEAAVAEFIARNVLERESMMFEG